MRVLARLLLPVIALALSSAAARADYTLTILHINDWHSRIESINKSESTCSAEEETRGVCVGGAARLVTAIAAERARFAGENLLLLDAGDNFQGSLFYTAYKGKAEAEFLDLMRFDAMALGNHEFDDGEDALAGFLDLAKFPVLAANVTAKAGSKLGDRVKPSVMLELGGQRIGIVGAVTKDSAELSSPGPTVAISDDLPAIASEVARLKAQGVDKIIALTHVGYRRDVEAIAKIAGIDVVVGGHSHTLLSNTDPKAEGPYPTMVDGPDGARVAVVQAASYSKVLGELTITFDDAGVVKTAIGNPIPLDASIKPDQAVLARIAELGGPLEAVKHQVIGQTVAALDGGRDACRARECALGDLVADAMLDRVKGQGVTIAIQNGGGIRASIDAGPVTMGEVLTVLPFQNTVATFLLSGRDLRESLEAGLSGIEDGAGRFPQVAGLRYSFDASARPNGGRLRSVDTMEGGAWIPLDPQRTYGVATNNYLRRGGDGYKLFAAKAEHAYDFGPNLEQVVADYLGRHSPYTPSGEARIIAVTSGSAK